MGRINVYLSEDVHIKLSEKIKRIEKNLDTAVGEAVELWLEQYGND